jgi:Rrf2 family protein
LKLPYELTAKTLQKLKEAGFVASQQGTQGGYKLIQPLNEISFAQVMDAIEGSFTAVECVGSEDCARDKFCELKTGMQEINQQIHELLSGIKLDQVMKRPIEQKGTQAV